MEDLTSAAAAYYHQSVMAMKQQPEILPEQEQLKCPRCDSPNTKFCYYNNYNLSQPRHFCKNCRRYWTKGGALRNIPVGGGSRKNTKRTGSGSGSGSGSGNQKKSNAFPDLRPNRSSESEDVPDLGSNRDEEERITGNSGQELDPTRMLLYGLPIGDQIGGSFSSLLATNMQMGGIIFDGLSETGSRLYPALGMGYRRSEAANDGGGCGGSENAWTDLAMKRVEKN